jgi:arabinose-5-phosphate isomerase
VTDTLAIARRTLRLEGEAVLAAGERLDGALAGAVELLVGAGRVIVSGIGKSGIIAQKIAATLTSTGTAASFVHPVDSLHGDLGLVDRQSVAILLSKSGETDELMGLLGALVRLEVPIIAITGVPDSTLGHSARFVLDAGVAEEACPHDLAPTTSTAVALALGDGLAMALLERKDFGRADFAALHPGGRLGRKLLLRVDDVMVTDFRALDPEATMQQVVVGLAHGRGIVAIVTRDALVGVVTAGDLTRLAEHTPAYLDLHANGVMTRSPRTVPRGELAASALGTLERASIMAAPVVDEGGGVVGIVHLHDLLRAGAG